jgi:hypothetical protein
LYFNKKIKLDDSVNVEYFPEGRGKNSESQKQKTRTEGFTCRSGRNRWLRTEKEEGEEQE